LCINAPELVDRAEILRDKGTNRKQFFRGLVDKYTWVDVGSSYVPSEIACAFLYAQLEMLEQISERRRQIYQRYHQRLQGLQSEGLLRLPHIPQDCTSNFHMFYVILRDRQTRDDLITHLKDQGIMAVFHYMPLHQSPMARKLGCPSSGLPVTEDLSGRLLRLPFYYDITEEEQQRVVSQVTDFLTRAGQDLRAPARIAA
jgi:dTDP-4-amino-4,6-dideoxygalactose transaminase